MEDIQKIRDKFKKYLYDNDIKSADTFYSDADYPRKSYIGIDYWDIFKDSDSIQKAFELLEKHFIEKGRKLSGLASYQRGLRLFKDFLDTTYGGVANIMSNNINYFWLNANPTIWSFLDKEIGFIETFSLVNDKGNKRQNPAAFTGAKTGDKIFGYESQKIVALLEIVEGAHFEDNEEVISVQIKELFSNPISIEALKNDPILMNSATVNNHQGTLFELTEGEFKRIECLLNPSKLLETLINEYQEFKTSEKYAEKYKWAYLEKNKNIFDNYENLLNKIKQLGAPNFVPYFWRTSAFRFLSELYSEQFSQILKDLFDENNDLTSRISNFRNEIKSILKNAPAWNKKDNVDPGVESATFFLFLKDYKKYLLFTRTTPFTELGKTLSMYDLLSFTSKEERYINWLNYCQSTLIPKLSAALNEACDLLDAQDFIWFVGRSKINYYWLNITPADVLNLDIGDTFDYNLFTPSGLERPKFKELSENIFT